MHYIDDNCTRKAGQSCMFEKPSTTTLELIISVNNLVNKAEFNYQISHTKIHIFTVEQLCTMYV